MNDMIINPGKFRAVLMSCDQKKENKYDLNVYNSIIISSVGSVTLLGIEIDSKLNFKNYVSFIRE